jgi:DHA2 family multidrug resistance protein
LSSSAPKYPVPHHGLITASVMAATLIQVLDVTVANVALPHIQGNLSASHEQLSWVLTSYIVASAVAIPLTGWLATRFGRKRLLLVSIFGFTVASMLCGLAQSLPQLVLFRFIQGLAGAALVPMSQAILLDINPPEKLHRAMSIWVVGVAVGPILGPVLGGWLTESYSWRWVFFINVPIGILCFLGLAAGLRETPRERTRFDVFGFATLSIGIIALQLMLDRGQLKDWFNSTEIVLEAVCAGIAFWLFAVHMATTREPFINPRIFKDVNFITGNFFVLAIGALLFAPLALLPPLLQGVMGYPVLTVGLLMLPRGIGTMAVQFVLGGLMKYLDARLVIALGFAFTAVALWQMSGFYLQMDQSPVGWSGFIQGVGSGMAYVPLATLTFGTLAPHLRNEGTAFFSLCRNLGSSIGIAIAQALFVRNTQIMHARLAEHVTPYSERMQDLPDLGTAAALATMDGRVTEQATMMAYNNVFAMMLVASLVCIPIVVFFRTGKSTPPPPSTAHAE